MTIEEALAFAFGKKSGTQLDEQIVMITLAREVERLRDAIRNLRKHGCYPQNNGKTHYADCWQTRGHHECAIQRVEELEAECPMCAASELKATTFERQVLELRKAIDRSGFDLSPCMSCGEPVVCIPDGIPMCEKCASN